MATSLQLRYFLRTFDYEQGVSLKVKKGILIHSRRVHFMRMKKIWTLHLRRGHIIRDQKQINILGRFSPYVCVMLYLGFKKPCKQVYELMNYEPVG